MLASIRARGQHAISLGHAIWKVGLGNGPLDDKVFGISSVSCEERSIHIQLFP